MRLPKQRSEKDRKENTPKTSTNIGCSNLMKRMLAVGLVVVAVSLSDGHATWASDQARQAHDDLYRGQGAKAARTDKSSLLPCTPEHLVWLPKGSRQHHLLISLCLFYPSVGSRPAFLPSSGCPSSSPLIAPTSAPASPPHDLEE